MAYGFHPDGIKDKNRFHWAGGAGKVKNQEPKEVAGCEGVGGDVFDVHGAFDAVGSEYASCCGAG